MPLKFYLFDLPFYSDLRGYLLALVIVCVLLYWVAARGWQLRHRLPELRDMRQIDPVLLSPGGGPRKPLPARRAGNLPAGPGPALFPGAL